MVATPAALSTIGQVLVYECLKCQRPTVCVQRDPGLTPAVMECRAFGEGACKNPATVVKSFPQGHREAPKPAWEFYRRVGLDYQEIDADMRELVDAGLLDLRSVKETLVRLAR